jgi:hypothetical protein
MPLFTPNMPAVCAASKALRNMRARQAVAASVSDLRMWPALDAAVDLYDKEICDFAKRAGKTENEVWKEFYYFIETYGPGAIPELPMWTGPLPDERIEP